MYELLIILKSSNVISDVLYFNTLEEAQKEMKFYKNFYDSSYKYEIVKEN